MSPAFDAVYKLIVVLHDFSEELLLDCVVGLRRKPFKLRYGRPYGFYDVGDGVPQGGGQGIEVGSHGGEEGTAAGESIQPRPKE